MVFEYKKFLSRMWLYFRVGHSTYLVFAISFANFIVIFYRFFIQYIPLLSEIFFNLTIFAVAFFIIYIPVSVLVGWSHYKRTPLFSSEQDIQVEANPYNYKIRPGKEEELIFPLYSVLVQFMKESIKQNIIKPPKDFETRLDQIEKKLETLSEGHYVGTPRRKYLP